MNVFGELPAMGTYPVRGPRVCWRLTLFLLCVLFVNNVSVVVGIPAAERSTRATLTNPTDTLRILDVPGDDFNFEQQQLEYEENELENIKQSVIQGLGLKRIPDVTKMNVSQEEYLRMYGVYLKKLEEHKVDGSDDDSPIPTMYTFYPKEKHTRRRRRKGTRHVEFNLKRMNEQAFVQYANLRLLVPGMSEEYADMYGNTVYVQVYQVMGQRRPKRLMCERSVQLSTRDPKWLELDLSEAARSWLMDGEKNLSLEIHCRECERRGLRLLNGPERPALNVLMLTPAPDVVVHGAETSEVRLRRSAEQALYYVKNRRTDCKKNSKRCCRHRMNFDLRQLGLEFIIQPKTFDGGICKGQCPPSYNSAHNHAVLQSLMWKKNKTLTPRVCCAPSKLRSLEILTVDEDDPAKLTVKHWENMIVMECACS